MNYKLKMLAIGPLVIAGIGVLGAVVMLLWNWIVPGLITGANPIDYSHAVGLLVLCRILLGGFRGRGGWHHRHHQRRWEKMSPEEREVFQQKMQGFRGRC